LKKFNEKNLKKRGRPPIKIDWEAAEKLLFLQCTCEEIASFLGVSHDTLLRRCLAEKRKTFEEYSKEKRAGGKASLRRKQWKMADSSPAMAIFLGKQYLGQKDIISNEMTGKDGNPLIPQNTNQLVIAVNKILGVLPTHE
jgi:hypothetical protein